MERKTESGTIRSIMFLLTVEMLGNTYHYYTDITFWILAVTLFSVVSTIKIFD